MAILAALLLMLVCLTLHCTTAIRFYLEPGQKRCFTEELPSNTKISGETRVTGGKGHMDIDVWVTTMAGKVLYHKRAAEHGKFSFQTPYIRGSHHVEDIEIVEDDYDYGEEHDEDAEEDTYKVCIEHQYSGSHSAGGRRSIYFRMQEMYSDIVDTDRAARSSDTDKLQTTMRSMHTTLSGMIGDLSQLQRRERALTKRMKRTSSRVTFLAVVALIVTLGTSALQYRYYKGYFKQKKLC